MGLLEKFAGREREVVREVKGLGTVKIRRLKAGEMLKIITLPEDKFSAAVVSLAVLEADGQKMFPAPEDVAETEWTIVRLLREAVFAVNSLDAEVTEAAKK